jgi:CRP-like cAMP-binding protein
MYPLNETEEPGRKGLPKTVSQFLEKVGRERALKAGESLFQEGEPGNSLFVVRSGSLNVYRELDAHRREFLAVIHAGEVVGELEFLDGGPRSLSVAALEDTKVLELDRSALERIEGGNPSVAFDLYSLMARLLSERARATNEQYKREIIRGIETSGTQILDLHYILRDTFHVEICLTGGEVFVGRVVLMTRSHGGYQITIMDKDGYLIWIPYGSVACIRALG